MSFEKVEEYKKISKNYYTYIILLGENAMTYKIKYDDDSDVLTIAVKEKGKLSHAEEVGDMILHVDDKGEPLFLEILRASKIVPLMVEGLAKKEVTVA